VPAVEGCGFGSTVDYSFFSTGFCVITFSLFPNKLPWGCCWPVAKIPGFCSPEVSDPNNDPPLTFILGNIKGFYSFLAVPDGSTFPNKSFVGYVPFCKVFSDAKFNVTCPKFNPPCGGNVVACDWILSAALLSANNAFSPNGWVGFFSYTLGFNNCFCYYWFFLSLLLITLSFFYKFVYFPYPAVVPLPLTLTLLACNYLSLCCSINKCFLC